MTPVLALDLSATKAGVALPDGTLRTLVAPGEGDVEPGEDWIGNRLDWWDDTLDILMGAKQPAVVAVEGYAFAAKTNALTQIAEVVGVVRRLTFSRALLYHEVSPQTLKKWATGNGNAGKDAMIEAARARGYNPANDDEADAALLREWVLEHLEVVG